MVNKTNALNRIEKIKHYLRNIKASAFRKDTSVIEEQFSTFEEMIDDLESIISSESEEYLNRPYGSL